MHVKKFSLAIIIRSCFYNHNYIQHFYFCFWGRGLIFCHIATTKEIQCNSYKRIFVEKKVCKTTKLPYFKARFSEIVTFGNHCFLHHVLTTLRSTWTVQACCSVFGILPQVLQLVLNKKPNPHRQLQSRPEPKY